MERALFLLAPGLSERGFVFMKAAIGIIAILFTQLTACRAEQPKPSDSVAAAIAETDRCNADARNAVAAIGSRLPLIPPEHDVALLQEAGFDNVELFYAAFTFKGWVAYRRA